MGEPNGTEPHGVVIFFHHLLPLNVDLASLLYFRHFSLFPSSLLLTRNDRLRTQLQLGSAAESEDDKRRVTPLVNEHYLVVFRKQTLHVWCFDEDTPLPPGSQRVPGGPAKLEYC